jgi:hypothetical protein
VTFDSIVREFVPPSAKHLLASLHALDRARPAAPASWPARSGARPRTSAAAASPS